MQKTFMKPQIYTQLWFLLFLQSSPTWNKVISSHNLADEKVSRKTDSFSSKSTLCQKKDMIFFNYQAYQFKKSYIFDHHYFLFIISKCQGSKKNIIIGKTKPGCYFISIRKLIIW